jgi:hypothetical protein
MRSLVDSDRWVHGHGSRVLLLIPTCASMKTLEFGAEITRRCLHNNRYVLALLG